MLNIPLEKVISDVCRIFNLVNYEKLTYEGLLETLDKIAKADDEYYEELIELRNKFNQ